MRRASLPFAPKKIAGAQEGAGDVLSLSRVEREISRVLSSSTGTSNPRDHNHQTKQAKAEIGDRPTAPKQKQYTQELELAELVPK